MDTAKPIRIHRENLSDQVCDLIKTMILENKWALGEKLPSEAALAQMFGVSRLTIRVALDKLNTLGLLETQVGRGTFVKRFNFDEFFDGVHDIMLLNEGMIDDVYEFRNTVELKCCELIVQSPEDVDLSSLHALTRQMTKTVLLTDGPSFPEAFDAYVELDYAFHLELCRLAGNELFHLAFRMAKAPMLRYLSAILAKRLRERRKNGRPAEVRPETDYRSGTHGDILRALETRDMQACRAIYASMNNYRFDATETADGAEGPA